MKIKYYINGEESTEEEAVMIVKGSKKKRGQWVKNTGKWFHVVGVCEDLTVFGGGVEYLKSWRGKKLTAEEMEEEYQKYLTQTP